MHRTIRTLLNIAFIASSTTLFAQAKPEDKVKVKVRIGLEQKPDGTMMPYSIIKSSPTSIMVLRSMEFADRAFTKKEPRLDVYDREKLVYERSMEPVMQRLHQDRLLLEDLVLFPSKPTLVARSGSETEIALFYQHVDPHLVRQPPAFDKLCTFPVEVKERHAAWTNNGNATREKWSTAIAADSAHMLIHSPELRGRDDGDAFYLLAMVDRNMQVKWQQILRVSGDSERSEVLDAAVDSTGAAYLLIKYRYTDGAPGGGADDYEVALHKVNADDMSRVPFTMDAGYYATGGILQPMGKQLAYAGIYAGDGNRKLGNFIAWMDTSAGGLSLPTLIPFPEGVDLEAEEVVGVDDADKKEEGKKAQKQLRSTTDVIALLPKADGGYFIVNEVAFSATYIDPESARRFQRFYHGPLQARSITKDGQQQWTTLFRRWVDSDDPILGRVYPLTFNEQLHMFLWDSDDTAEDRKLGGKIKPEGTTGLYTIYATFDDKGVFRTKAVLRADNDEALICGWGLVRTGKDEYIGMGTGSLVTVEYLPVRIDFMKEVKK